MAAAAMAASCSPAASGGDDDATSRAKFIAAGLDAIAPKSLGNGLTLTSASAKGADLVLAVKGYEVTEFMDPGFEKFARDDICSDSGFRGVIAKGVDIVLKMSAVSGSKRTVRVETC